LDQHTGWVRPWGLPRSASRPPPTCPWTSSRAATLIFTAFLLPDVTGARPPSDLVRIKYFPKVSEDGRFIELHREQSDLPLIENKIPTGESRLASRLLGFRVELFDGTAWQKEWPPSGGASKWMLPKKVSIVLTDFLGRV
jgi:hypothetical protein